MKPRHKITATTATQFRKVVESRRSVRKFTDEAIPDDVVNECLDWALLAPNSSNLQMWNFYRITTPAKKKGYTDLMVDGAPLPHQPDTIIRWLIDRLRS